MGIAELLRRHHADLTPAERRVADAILAEPQAVAFGTVASLAARARTGGATVLRTATKLGLDGYSELQAIARDDVSRRLRPAVERIREPASGDVISAAKRVETANLEATLAEIDYEAFDRTVRTLADPKRAVGVIASAAARGLGIQLGTQLSALRPGVQRIEGNQVDVLHQVANLPARAVVLALDFHRYDGWLLEALDHLPSSTTLVSVTDSPLSPLATRTETAIVVAGQGIGPFDSWIGALVVLQAISAGVAEILVQPATNRLDRAEDAWAAHTALRDT